MTTNKKLSYIQPTVSTVQTVFPDMTFSLTTFLLGQFDWC